MCTSVGYFNKREIIVKSATRVKTHKLLHTGLQTSYYKSVRKLSASCVCTACSMFMRQVWNNLLTTCNNFDGIMAR